MIPRFSPDSSPTLSSFPGAMDFSKTFQSYSSISGLVFSGVIQPSRLKGFISYSRSVTIVESLYFSITQASSRVKSLNSPKFFTFANSIAFIAKLLYRLETGQGPKMNSFNVFKEAA